MLQAQLRGKLTRREEALEDILTSDLFGSLKYVLPSDGLVPVLSRAVSLDGTAPFESLRILSTPVYLFWPKVQASGCRLCEPDVMILVPDSTMGKLFLLIEVKFKTGKSSRADKGILPNDQLAREWDNLLELAKQEQATPYLVYLTADLGFPATDLDEARAEFSMKRPNKSALSIVWLPWRQLPDVLSKSNHEILKDVSEVLVNVGLLPFRGVRAPPAYVLSWLYSKSYGWSQIEFVSSPWRYRVKSNAELRPEP